MGLFSKKKITCPICKESASDGINHYESHVRQIPPGHGNASGQYTWECVCGPSGKKWQKEVGAAAGLMLHMQDRHGLPL